MSASVRYKTIVADPPWKYSQGLSASALTRGSAEKVYPVMEDAAILAVPVQDFAAQDCQLWLWTTNSHIHLALHCLEAWGFTYKTMATWVKTQFGLGYWLRGQTEHVLLGVRGSPRSKFVNTKHGATGKAWSTVINAARSSHSEKPEAFLDMVEAMGEPPYLEMFARRQRLGWDVWVDGRVVGDPPSPLAHSVS